MSESDEPDKPAGVVLISEVVLTSTAEFEFPAQPAVPSHTLTARDCVADLEQWSDHCALQCRELRKNKAEIEQGISRQDELQAKANYKAQRIAAYSAILLAIPACWVPIFGIIGAAVATIFALRGVANAQAWQDERKRLQERSIAPIDANMQLWTDEKEAVDRLLRKMEREAHQDQLAAVTAKQLPEGPKGPRRRRKKRGR